MLTLRPSSARGHFNHGWLDSRHTFSFAEYRDPAHMGFRSLRVINEDIIAPGEGFPTHPHHDMEILTYVISGKLAHKDSMGNGRTIEAGEVQGMSAGTGITHSEYNASRGEPVHLLQIWIVPRTRSVTPAYGEWKPEGAHRNAWSLAASGDGAEGSILIQQDARMYVGLFDDATEIALPVEAGRHCWLQVAAGDAALGGITLAQGDGAAFAAEDASHIRAEAGSELLLFDLA